MTHPPAPQISMMLGFCWPRIRQRQINIEIWGAGFFESAGSATLSDFCRHGFFDFSKKLCAQVLLISWIMDFPDSAVPRFLRFIFLGFLDFCFFRILVIPHVSIFGFPDFREVAFSAIFRFPIFSMF